MGRLRYTRVSARGRFFFWATALFLVLSALCWAALAHMKPILTNLAVAHVSNTVNRIVAASVSEAINSGVIDYDTLVLLEKDEYGHVTALRSNMGEVNRLQTAIADDILQRISDVPMSELSIPMGTLTGSALLAGRGPSLHVRMQAVGSTAASFRNEFTAAGINQTKHRIILEVDVSMSILLPAFTTSTNISNEIAVAETVIVGSVPETYTYFSTSPEESRQYAEDYIMNNG